MLRSMLLTICAFGFLGQAAAQTDRPVDLRWGVKIPMRDGVLLNATLYEPSDRAKPLPCVFTLTPYISSSYHDRGMHFARSNFVFLTVDVRGRGNSQGQFVPLLQEAKDGHDAVEWLAQQPFCNGRVAMWGGSYAGYNQWATAKELPKHLTTIVPAAAAQMGVDFPMRGNIFHLYVMRWLTFVTGAAINDKLFADGEFWLEKNRRQFRGTTPFTEFDSVAGNPHPLWQEWVSHPEQGPYWDQFNPTREQYARLNLPVLTITGSYDDDQPGALAFYRQHMRYGSSRGRASHYLIIGPWDHAGTRTPKLEFNGVKVGPSALVDLNRVHSQWYDWTMGRGNKPEFLKDRVAYYVIEQDRWRYAKTLEAVTKERRPFHLDSINGQANDVFASGLLTPGQPRSAAPDGYRYDPRDLQAAEIATAQSPDGPSFVDQVPTYLNVGKGLIYHTEPLSADLELSGFLGLSVWLEVDRPDTDFLVRVYEVKPDGTALFLSSDQRRARYREDLRQAKLVPSGQVLRYDFEGFTFMSRVITKGSRLRLVFGPADSVDFQRNFQSGRTVATETMRDAQVVNVRLYHDKEHASVLYVPIGQP